MGAGLSPDLAQALAAGALGPANAGALNAPMPGGGAMPYSSTIAKHELAKMQRAANDPGALELIRSVQKIEMMLRDLASGPVVDKFITGVVNAIERVAKSL
jgi:hypothetical protein